MPSGRRLAFLEQGGRAALLTSEIARIVEMSLGEADLFVSGFCSICTLPFSAHCLKPHTGLLDMDLVREVLSVAHRDPFEAEHLAEIEKREDLFDAMFLENRQFPGRGR